MLAAPAVRAQDQPAGQQPTGQEQPRPAGPASSPPAFEIPASQQVDGPGSLPTPTPAQAPAPAEPRVQIAEVVIEGLDGPPERERLELAAYAAMRVNPGTRVSRSELETDLAAIYATGWFSDVRIQPVDGPLGVRLIVSVVPNPVLQSVRLQPVGEIKLPDQVVGETFATDYG
ncbi:MAG: hypothetical protein ACK516_02795, partial [Cyanobium sp.]